MDTVISLRSLDVCCYLLSFMMLHATKQGLPMDLLRRCCWASVPLVPVLLALNACGLGSTFRKQSRRFSQALESHVSLFVL